MRMDYRGNVRRSRVAVGAIVALFATVLPVSRAGAASPPPWNWVHETGTVGQDYGAGVVVSTLGEVFVVGTTDHHMPGAPEAWSGGIDMWVARYNTSGTRIWIHQFGSGLADFAGSIAVDPTGSAIYVGGITEGTLPGWGSAPIGSGDAFVAKYLRTGSLSWVQQFGTATEDQVMGLAVAPSGRVIVSGDTGGTLPGSPEPHVADFDAFVASYTSAGSQQWVHQLGSTRADAAQGVTTDSAGRIFVAGRAEATLPGAPEVHVGPDGRPDAFVASYLSNGTRRWVHNLGSTQVDGASSVAVDNEDRIVISGQTSGRLPGSPTANAGDDDAFVAAYGSNGVRRWVRQLGSSFSDIANGIAVGADDEVYAVGYTFGTLPGSVEPNAGYFDAFLLRYDVDGALLGVHEFGTAVAGPYPSGFDTATSVAVRDSDGQVIVTGGAGGTLPGATEPFAGFQDVFVASANLPNVVPGTTAISEGNTGTQDVAIPVTLSLASTRTVTVDWNTVDFGSKLGFAQLDDYVATSGTVTFAPGETAKTVSVTINGDTVAEGNEYVVVSFHGATNAKIGGFFGLGTALIQNDD